jgi:hypothetical protein
LYKFNNEMSKKRQRCGVVNLENNFSISTKFTAVYYNCKQELSQNKHKKYQKFFSITYIKKNPKSLENSINSVS